ncbi:MAG: HigA family addiction module antidote protein [Nitrospira sp.]
MTSLSEKPIHPGEVLAEVYMKPAQSPVTVYDLADSIDVPLQELANFIGGIRPVTPPLAARLAMRFRTTTRFWLGLQNLYSKQSQAYQSSMTHHRAKN